MKRILIMLLLAIAVPAVLFAAMTSLSGGGNAEPESAKKQPVSVPREYRVIVKRNVFGFAPREEKPESAATATASIPVPPRGDIVPMFSGSMQDLPPISGLPLVGQPGIAQRFTLTGIIEINSEFRAIIENKQDGTGGYYAEGDSLEEFIIVKIERDRVILDDGFGQVTLMHPSSGISGYSVEPAPRGGNTGPAPQPDYDKLPRHIRQRLGR